MMKAVRSLEIDRYGLADPKPEELERLSEKERKELIMQGLRIPGPDRLWTVARAYRDGWTEDAIYRASGVDPWFLAHLAELVELEEDAGAPGLLDDEFSLRYLKQNGFSDAEIAGRQGVEEKEVRVARHRLGVRPVYKQVDTCAAEFEAHTPISIPHTSRKTRRRRLRARRSSSWAGAPTASGRASSSTTAASTP